MLREWFRNIIESVIEEAISSGERRLIALAGKNSLEVSREVIKIYSEMLGENIEILYSGKLKDEVNIEGSEIIKEVVRPGIKLSIIPFEKSELAMGGTWDALIMNLRRQLMPNDIGRLTETVKGGGLIIIVLPNLNQWLNTLTDFQKKLVTPPYTEKDVRQLFKQRFIKELKNHEGCWLIDLDSETVYGNKRQISTKKLEYKPPSSDPIKSLALTESQYKVIEAFEEMAFMRGKRSLVLIANRGRGKSAALGLSIAKVIELLKGGKIRIIVSAPEVMGVKVLFDFIAKGLNAAGIKYKLYMGKLGLPIRIKAGKSQVVYMNPLRASETGARIKVVDEAASTPVPMLQEIVNSVRFSVFSSTIHGYEGAGRGFSVRFLKSLKEMKELDVREIKMEEPIRYPEGDPIETWLYDTLLLNAEPEQLSSHEMSKKPEEARYVKLDLESLFMKDEKVLRQLYGIYVLAHYRNRPNDLGTLADAPHHFARALMLGDKVVVSLQLANEGDLGNLDVERVLIKEEPPGHIIPNRVALHYGVYDLAVTKGLRIVRIATHPQMMDKGFGSKALRELILEAKELGYDWIGTGFGASKELVNFWIKNSFIPLHISPVRNPVSGEFSVLMALPITRRAKRGIAKVNKEFKKRLITTLHDIYFSLEPSVARLLLKPGYHTARPNYSRSQEIRIRGYIRGFFSYEAASDAIFETVKAYFMDSNPSKPKLSENIEDLLIAKVLQGKTWNWVRKDLGIPKPMDVLRESLEVLVEYYGEK